MVKGAAQGGLDTSNSAFPGTKSAMLAGFAGAMDMARGTAQTGLHPSKHILTGTEDMVCAGVTSIMDTAKDSQKNMDTTRDRLSTMLAHSGNVPTNAIHTGAHIVPSSLSGSHPPIYHESINPGVGPATLTSTKFLSCETSSFLDTYGLGHVTEPTAPIKNLVSGMTSSPHTAIRSMEECGHPAATHFATLPDELKGLGDFFQPMTAEEQGECLPFPITGPWGLGFGETPSPFWGSQGTFQIYRLIAFLQLSWQPQSQGPEYSLPTGEATTSAWVIWPRASASGLLNMP